MNQQAKNLNCILNILDEDISSCNRKDICLRPDECRIRDALQPVLEIPKRFSKAILITMDMQAKIYRYLDYIGAKGVIDTKEGFTNDQCNAMFKHYGVDEEGKPGKARSIVENKGILYDIYKNGKSEPKLLEFDKSDDKCIQWEFHGEKAVGIPIPCGSSDIVPVLILFLKNNVQNEVKNVKEFVEDKERSLKIRLIIKDTRMESLGKLVSAIPAGDKPGNDPRGKFSRWLLGWLEERDGLWLGNKIWFVVDHGLVHAKNLWKLANELTDEKVANLGNKLKELNKMNPLIFSLAIWLHDIGYKGIHSPLLDIKLMKIENDLIINKHGIISAALILKSISSHKDAYNLHEFDNEILARSSLICAYHQKECPITSLEKKAIDPYDIPEELELNRENKFVDFLAKESGAIIPKDSHLILEKLRFTDDFTSESLTVMASLLRLLDSCDFNRNRVGSLSMIKLREDVCNDNAESLKDSFATSFSECIDMANNKVEDRMKKGTPEKDFMIRNTMKKYRNEISKIIKDYVPSSQKDPELETFRELLNLFDTKSLEKKEKEDAKKFMDTWYLGRFIGLLNQQKHYYEIHNSVKSVSFIKSKNKTEGAVDLVYEIDEEILTRDEIEEKIKQFIASKTARIYNVKSLLEKEDQKIVFTIEECFKQPQKTID